MPEKQAPAPAGQTARRGNIAAGAHSRTSAQARAEVDRHRGQGVPGRAACARHRDRDQGPRFMAAVESTCRDHPEETGLHVAGGRGRHLILGRRRTVRHGPVLRDASAAGQGHRDEPAGSGGEGGGHERLRAADRQGPGAGDGAAWLAGRASLYRPGDVVVCLRGGVGRRRPAAGFPSWQRSAPACCSWRSVCFGSTR